MMSKPVLSIGLIFTLIFTTSIMAQPRMSHKEMRADRHFEQQSYFKAAKLYKKIVSKSYKNERARLKLARTYFMSNEMQQAELIYSEVIHKKYLVKSIDYLNYARVLQSQEKFKNAEKWVRKYLSINPRNIIAQNMIYSLENINRYYKDSSRYVVTALNINTEAADFSPSYFREGLVFASSRTRKYNLKRKYSRDHSKYLNLYYSEALIGSDMMTAPVKIKGEISNKFHQGPATFFNDYQEVIYTSNSNTTSELSDNNLKLFKATYSVSDKKWKNVGLLPFNSDSYSTGHPAISKDEKTLYFVSNKPGGHGGTDLYKTQWVNGKWNTPVNLGPEINTPGDELFPYVDEQFRLFFASNGHGGLGGLDIFYVDLFSSEARVINMGFPINSSKDDFGLIHQREKDTGYFSSDRGGQSDLFKFIDQGHILNVQVRNEGLDPVVDAGVSLLSNDLILKKATTSQNGEVTFVVSPNQNFQVSVTSEGNEVIHTELTALTDDYTLALTTQSLSPKPIGGTLLEVVGLKDTLSYVLTNEGVIEVKDQGASEDWLNNLLSINNIIIEQEVSINPILYAFDKVTFESRGTSELDKLAKLMKKYDFIEFELGAHTDAIGSDEYNQHLSELRARAAVNYLTEKQIKSERLLAIGYGETSPANNCSDDSPCGKEKHRINRRTEFRLIYMDENQVVSNY